MNPIALLVNIDDCPFRICSALRVPDGFMNLRVEGHSFGQNFGDMVFFKKLHKLFVCQTNPFNQGLTFGADSRIACLDVLQGPFEVIKDRKEGSKKGFVGKLSGLIQT